MLAQIHDMVCSSFEFFRSRRPSVRFPARNLAVGRTSSASTRSLRAARAIGGAIALLATTLVPGLAWSNSVDYDAFNTKYGTLGKRIDAKANCVLCHTSVPALNSYGMDYKTAVAALSGGRSATNSPIAFGNIESLDSDGDGMINIAEIANLNFPGNGTDTPPRALSNVV